MTRWELRQLQKKRKEERTAQIINMVGGVLFALMIGAVFFFAR
jgi:high-affinity Fe2+/Pb2+ permease